MKTRNLGINIDQNTDFVMILMFHGDDGPIDVTGYQFKSEMRATTDPNSPVVATFQFTILDQLNSKGQVKWFLPAASNDLAHVKTSVATPLIQLRQTTPFVYDIKMKDTAGTITRIIQGIAYVSPEATQEVFP